MMIALAFAGSGTDRAADGTAFAAANMLHSHNAAFDASKSAGFPEGEIQISLPYPLQPVGAWTSEIVSDDGGSYLLTWLSELNDGVANDRGFESALAKLNAPGARRNLPAAAFAGIFKAIDETSGFIGSTAVPLPSAAIQSGAPAVGSIIR